jgi:hypothetical protein
MIKDFDSPYDGRHEGAARLGQDRHFTGSVSQYHGGCGPLSSYRTPSSRVFAKIKGANASYRTDPPDSGTARSPDPDGQRYRVRSRRPAAVAAPGAWRPRARRPTARPPAPHVPGCYPSGGATTGPCGDSLVRLGRSRRLWRLGSSRAVPDGRRAASARPEPRLCSFWVAFFRPQASACSEGGAMRPERHTMTPLSALVGVHGDGGDVVPLPGRHRPPPDEDHGVGARPERLGDAVRRLASSTSGLIAVGGLLAGGGLLVDGIFGAV